MMTTSATRGRGFARDPDEDAETRVYVKPPMPWDRVMVLQIMRDLEPGGAQRRNTPTPQAPRPAPVSSVMRAARPNVFLTPLPSDPPPPWGSARRNAARERVAPESGPRPIVSPRAVIRKVAQRKPRAAAPREDETLVRPRWRHQAPRRMMLPWFLFLMYFLIAFGIGQDRTLRRELFTQARTVTAQSAAVVQSSAIRLWHLVSGIDA